MAFSASAITINTFASRSLFGTAKIPFLKERLFGLTGKQGNHGEDVKEVYYYLDATPTGSYLKGLYKYPQAAFPYEQLVAENHRRTRLDPEYELQDTGIFDESRYFDIFAEYAKHDVDDILIRVTVVNRGPEPAELTFLPTLWFRNTWSWGRDEEPPQKPLLHQSSARTTAGRSRRSRHFCVVSRRRARGLVHRKRDEYGTSVGMARSKTRSTKMRFTNTSSTAVRTPSILRGQGTKACAVYRLNLAAGRTVCSSLPPLPGRFARPSPRSMGRHIRYPHPGSRSNFMLDFPTACDEDAKRVQRQAFGGMFWSKQFYHFVVETWLNGDPGNAAAARAAQTAAAITNGVTSSTKTSFQCPTNGSIRGTPPGISRFTRLPLRPPIPISRKRSSRCSCANGTCTRTASCPLTNGRSAT